MSMPNMNPLAFEFFAKFARFEFALKHFDSYRTCKPDGAVEPCWDNFAKSTKIQTLYSTVEKDPAMRVMVDKGPRKRIVKDGNLDWSDFPSRQEDMIGVCVMLRRARNNLFHGDKGDGYADREPTILAAGLAILDLMLTTDANIGQFF
jgi:hypothetical protein